MRYLARPLVLLAIVSAFLHGTAAPAQNWSTAPTNPDFLTYMGEDPQAASQDRGAQTQSESQQLLQTAITSPPEMPDGHPAGYIPPPVAIPSIPQSQGARVLTATDPLPSSYDLRTEGKLTPVKDQGSCGSCWAFAAYGSLESNLLPDETRDFSENHLKNTHMFSLGCCAGGNAYISAAYLARWSGPVREIDDPYNIGSCSSPSGLSPVKHVQDIIMLEDRSGYLDNDRIKRAVMEDGAAYTSMYWSNTYYNQGHFTYYCPSTGQSNNHAVCIVGWDDSFDKSLFASTPPGNGAFIVRNSWGTSWGDSGYFYVSYYDATFAHETTIFCDAQPTDNYKENYQYDPLGWTTSIGAGSETAWGGNVFTAQSSSQISAVSFYAASSNTSYLVQVYDNPTSGPINSSGPVLSTEGTLEDPGYHTVPLGGTYSLTASNKFSVVVKLTTPGYSYPLPCERPISGYSGGATSNPGESFISEDGITWTDLTSRLTNGNLCVKAFTASCHGLAVMPGAAQSHGPVGGPFTPSSFDYTLKNTGTESLTWTASKSAAWLDLSAVGGTLAPDEQTVVTVSINSSAESLPDGVYTDYVEFANTSGGCGSTTRKVELVARDGTISVSPESSLNSHGAVGGPFSPSSKQYTVTNVGFTPLSWTAGKQESWLTLSSGGGTLDPGQQATVIVSINSEANSLPEGMYTDTVTFTNTTNGLGDTVRNVVLGMGPIFVKTDGDDGNAGLSWETAKKTIQAGISAAVTGDEVRVAQGTYVELITLKSGVKLYGGYSGVGTTRDIAAYVTTIDGNQSGAVVVSPSGGTADTAIDGFTIRNGKVLYYTGGGIVCDHSSPTITNNTIMGNTGGGIYCSSSSSTISNNTITGNDGCGVDCKSSSLTIANNTITGNSDSAIRCPSGSTASITGNTIRGNGSLYTLLLQTDQITVAGNLIVGNTSGEAIAIYINSDVPGEIAVTGNTIVANGGVGVRWGGTQAKTVTCSKNFIACNGGIGIKGDWGTISGNAVIANDGDGIKVTRSSTIINNTIVENGGVGLSAAGIQYYVITLAADNNIVAYNGSGVLGSAYTTPLLYNNCVYGNVGYNYSGIANPTGTNGNMSVNPRLTPDNKHIQADSPCINAGRNTNVPPGETDIDGQARINNGTVDIGADESYGETWPTPPPTVMRITPTGDDANDGSAWDDAHARRTISGAILDTYLRGAEAEVWVKAGTYAEHFRLLKNVYIYGGFHGDETSRSQRDIADNETSLVGGVRVPAAAGIFLTCFDGFTLATGSTGVTIAYGVTTISHNTLHGCGISCTESPSAITDNMISDAASAGISCDGSACAAQILRNTITDCAGGVGCSYAPCTISDNTISGNHSSGIHCVYSSPTIRNNRITGNTDTYGAGIDCANSSSATITNNTIMGNIASFGGGGIACVGASPKITNNTIAGNSATSGGGIYCASSSPTISNNIVAFNSSGIFKYSTSGTPSLRNNDVYANAAYNYSGLSPGTGDISADPLFPSPGYGNPHIQPGSPCRNAGWNSAPGLSATDMDGQARIEGGTVDIGADESYGETWTVTPAIIRVTPTGNDANDGLSWDLAKRTVQAGIDAAWAALGAEVWVKAGTYDERVTLRPYAHLYGGFVGTEAARSERNWTANATILDGGGAGTAVTAICSERVSTIDGFTIRNGSATSGGGIYCNNSSSTITNNTIAGNSATNGGGIYCQGAACTLSSNTVTGNTANGKGGGIYLDTSGHVLTNNRVEYNHVSGGSTAAGGGIYLNTGGSTISGNIVIGNTSTGSAGGINCLGATTILRNMVVGNSCSTNGAGVYFSNAAHVVQSNLVVGNSTPGEGGGFYLWNSTSANVSGNTLVGNDAGQGGGICFIAVNLALRNNIVAFNSSGICKTGLFGGTVQYNDVYGNTDYNYSGLSAGTGDISLDPLFVDKDGGNYHLQSGSPCIDAGSSTSAPTTDFEGCIRPQDGDGNGTALYDIGAYEYPMNLAKAKKDFTDGSAVAFGGTPVTAFFTSPARIYVERSDRSQGIRVDTSKTFAEGELVNVSGTIQTDPATGERYVSPGSTYPASIGTTSALRPCAMIGRFVGGAANGLQAGVLGGVDLNNIGLLVTLWGSVTAFDDPVNPSAWLKISDGSPASVKVAVPSGVTINKNWQYVIVTGVVSCEKSGSDLLPVLKVRKQADIIPIITGSP